ncbi:MAG: ABC transporter permease [Candidatus Accumulibacter phosphatis]|uniref:ABC transporter permease n=1 Tax=Candidatus Accumulibacter sp. ACC012 TaxID=2823332 RepID=UPI0025C6B4DE|nr:ABC transporter permease [Candidatus Accumulibacter sp. ACC012]
MNYLIALAVRSAWNRRYTLSFTLLSIALATSLLVGVERLRHDVRESFSQSVSGTDLVVGARASPVQLMLYAVFRIGEATQNMRWTSAQKLAHHPAVAWNIPLSLGDSHHGFPVLGTSLDYFTYFRFGDRQPLRMQAGKPFAGVFDAVLGAEVARKLAYQLGQKIVLAHGSVALEGAAHSDKPFFVVGILAPTGTPVDRTVHISLTGMEAIHLDWQGGAPVPGFSIPPELVKKFDLTPKTITAQLIGLKQRGDVFAMQRAMANDVDEPLMGVMPGVALDQLWEVVGQGEKALLLVSWMVALVGLGGLVAVILASLDARRRELAILRSVGARPRELLLLLALEGVSVTVGGMVAGLALLAALLFFGTPWIEARYGISLNGLCFSGDDLVSLATLLGWILLAGSVASLLPGLRAYRLSLIDGLSPRT